MQQIERIEYMEQILNEAMAVVVALSSALENYAAISEKLGELSDYYGSQQWFADYDDDRAGRLPSDLKRGVLSEDGVYDLLEANTRLLEELSGFAQM